MTPQEKAAYLITQSMCALAEIAGMQADNQEREHLGLAPAYQEKAFAAVPEKYGICHNQVMEYLRE